MQKSEVRNKVKSLSSKAINKTSSHSHKTSKTSIVSANSSHETNSVKIVKKSQKKFDKLADQSMQQFLTDCHLSTSVTSQRDNPSNQKQDTCDINMADVSKAQTTDSLVEELQNLDSQRTKLQTEKCDAQVTHCPHDVQDAFDASEIPPPLNDLDPEVFPLTPPVIPEPRSALESESRAEVDTTTHKSEIKLVLGTQPAAEQCAVKTNRSETEKHSRDSNALTSPHKLPISPAKPSSTPADAQASEKRGLVQTISPLTRTVPSPDVDLHKKSVTVFSLLTSHHLLPFSLHKTSQRSFGISVKRDRYALDDVTLSPASSNVVIVVGLSAQCPKCVSTSLLPGDVILEVIMGNIRILNFRITDKCFLLACR